MLRFNKEFSLITAEWVKKSLHSSLQVPSRIQESDFLEQRARSFSKEKCNRMRAAGTHKAKGETCVSG